MNRTNCLRTLGILLVACGFGACSRSNQPEETRRESLARELKSAPAPSTHASSSQHDGGSVAPAAEDDASSAASPTRSRASCSNDASDASRLLESTVARATATQGVERRAVSDLASFAWSFYAQVRRSDTNFVYSPYSIAAASAMLSAGAAGRTLTQIRTALRFSGVGAPLHEAHNALALLLHSRNRNHAGDPERKTQVLRISNDLWMAPESPPKPAFLDALERHYGSGVHLVSFHEDPERSRGAINQKVCRDTEGLIPELLPRDSIQPDIKLVLTNALYFKAGWESPFAKGLTEPRPFLKLSGETTRVATMRIQHGPTASPATC